MDHALYDLIREDRRYPLEAYEFLCEAMEFTQELLDRVPDEDDDDETDYHINGEELTRGTCELAMQEFGLMAPTVFKLWNIHRTDDIGQLVFNLIRIGRLSQSDRDDLMDFHDLFDLKKALLEGFQLTPAWPARKGER